MADKSRATDGADEVPMLNEKYALNNPQATPDDIIEARGGKYKYNRIAEIKPNGEMDLSQMSDDEIVVSPGVIYRRLP